MSTTTIRLPEDLKRRVQAAAETRGQSAHALILEAIAEKAELCERQSEFYDVAEQRLAGIAGSGMTVEWSDMREYLRARVEGRKVSKPRARKFTE